MIREPVVAGRFYAGNANDLLAEIRSCETSSLGVGNNLTPVHGRLVGLILPHAGYMFSGPVVSWGMKRLTQEQPLPARFLMLGPKHTPYGAEAAVSSAKAWKTPLGNVSIDETLRQSLVETRLMEADNDAHSREHSLEVMLPFLQKNLGSAPFTVAPVAFHYASFLECRQLGEGIAQVLAHPKNQDVRVIVSSDFSHETPRDEAYRLDAQALDLIEQVDAEGFYNLVVNEDRSICGVIPITIFLSALRGRKVKASRLKYSTSMDVMEHPRGVGYAAVMFEEVA